MEQLIYKEDFSKFENNEFPYDHEHSAIGEYHYFEQKGYKGDFYDPIPLHQWRSQGGSWMIVEENNIKYLEQNRGDYTKGHFINVMPILVLNKTFYAPYHIRFNLRCFETTKMVGYSFNYIDNRKYDAFIFEKDLVKLINVDGDKVSVYQEKEFIRSDLETYKIDIYVSDCVEVYIFDKLILKTNIKFISAKSGFVAKCSSRYSNLEIFMDINNIKLNDKLEEDEDERINNLQKQYPPLKCINKINLKNFGSGRQLRFINYKGNMIFLLAQHQKRIMRDSFARLSCLTAFDINGNVLWQKGLPNNDFEHTVISCDLPFQIADINGDGIPEVIYAMDFYVYFVELLTGNIIKKMPTPLVKGDNLVLDYPFDRLNPDGLRVADFEGLGYKGDFILKDRYKNLFVYRYSDFKLLWRYNHNNTGHFPYVYDFNKDGKDELYVGYDLLDSNGKIKWSLPINSDHTDEIIYLPYKKGVEPLFYLASGNEGFNIVDINGNILKNNYIGHAQRISAANFNPNKNELDIAVTSFWGADQIIYLFDGKGNKLKERELLGNGNLASCVSYDGTNFLILTNANPKCGGLLNHNLDTVVRFPDDGHPDLCQEALDIDNDGITEIICWDQNEMWIYKASNYKPGLSLISYPSEGFSNYRGEFLIKKEVLES